MFCHTVLSLDATAIRVIPVQSVGTDSENLRSRRSKTTVAPLIKILHTFQPLWISNFYNAAMQQTAPCMDIQNQNHGGIVYGWENGCKTWLSDRDNNFGGQVCQEVWKPEGSFLVVVASPLPLQSPLHFNCCHTNRATMTGPVLLAAFLSISTWLFHHSRIRHGEGSFLTLWDSVACRLYGLLPQCASPWIIDSLTVYRVLNYLPQRSQLVVSSDIIFLEASKTNKKKQSVI